ncbi:hypothetical protein C5C00_13300 [Rathayibacter rathayi]|nr:hypothetical protein C5C00_13300 [Rathayibacter rathayi]
MRVAVPPVIATAALFERQVMPPPLAVVGTVNPAVTSVTDATARSRACEEWSACTELLLRALSRLRRRSWGPWRRAAPGR